jgi:hypothetical protein
MDKKRKCDAIERQAANEEKFLKWRRYREKLFMVRFRILLFQQRENEKNEKSEAE